MKSLAVLPLVFVPLLWVPCGLTGLVTAVCPDPTAAAVAPVSLEEPADDQGETAMPSGFSVEYPREPLLLGSRFELVVRGPDLQSLQLGVEDHLGDVILGRVMRRDEKTGAAGKIVELRRPISIAREGDYSLPLAVVDTAGETTELPPVELSVRLDVPDGHRSQVSDLLDPVAVPVPPASPWPFIGVAVAGLVLLGWLVVAEGREKAVFVYHPPADRVAMEALADLRQHLPKTREEIRPFLIRLSDVLRVYIENVFQLHAPALTTEEFLGQAAQAHNALSERHEMLAEFLQRCDLVKYAGDRPAPVIAEPLLEMLESFVEDTRDVVAELPEPDAVTGVLSPADRLRVASHEPEPGHADGEET